MSEFNEKASTPPDTATDAGRAVFRIGFGWLKGDHIPIGTDLALASDLDAVSAERDALYDEATCAEEALEGGLVDFPDAPTDFDCLGKMADELVRQYRSRLDAVTAERDALQKQVERLKTVPMKYRRMEFNAQLQNQLAAKEQELEKEKAQSQHLAEAMSRTIDELLAAEKQCSYYKTQYTRAEQIRKEACEANVKAQAKMLWQEDALAASQREFQALEAVHEAAVGAGVVWQQECERLREALRELREACCGDLSHREARTAFRLALVKADEALATGGRHD